MPTRRRPDFVVPVSVGAVLCALAVAVAAAIGLWATLGGSRAAEAAPGAGDVFDPARLDMEPEFATWGVVGKSPNVHADQQGHQGIDDLWTGPQPEVWDTQEIDGRMFVGGIFTGVRRNEFWYPNEPVQPQAHLAAFDLDGQWIPGFAPQINGPVYDMAVGPNGSLLFGGEFTEVNGEPRSGLVALDPATGAIDPTFQTGVGRLWGDPNAYVKELIVDGGDLYVAGSFTHILQSGNQYRVWSIARLDASTGALDASWLPNATGSGIFDLAIDHTRGRVHLVGYFSALDGLPGTNRVGTVRLDDGRAVPDLGQHPFNHAWNNDQVGVTLAADDVWVIGGNHWLVIRDPDTGAVEFTQTVPGSGDLQVAETIGDWVMTGHHQQGGGGLWAWNPVTRTKLPLVFSMAKRSFGIWSVELASDGCLWVGGDPIRTLSGEWLGGFGRFCSHDNLATGGVATQSSNWSAQTTAAQALDGNSLGSTTYANPAITGLDAQAWWEVDLGSVRNIGDIELFRRTDACCRDRFADVHVLVSDVPFTGPSLANGQATPGVSDFFHPGTANRRTRHSANRTGRYVRVQLEGTNHLTLAEVRVHEGAPPDIQDPSGPLGPDATTDANSVTLTWNPSNDNVGVVGYLIHENYQYLAYVAGAGSTTYTHSGLTAGDLYRYQVRAKDAAGNTSIPSVRLDVIVGEGVRVPDNLPLAVTPTQIDATTVEVDWQPPTNPGGIRGYLVHDNYAYVTYVHGVDNHAYTHAGLTPGSTHRYEIRSQGNGVTSLPTERVTISLD